MPVLPTCRRISHGWSDAGCIHTDPAAVLQGKDGAASKRLREPKKSTRPGDDSRTMGGRGETDAWSHSRVHLCGGRHTMKLTQDEVEFLSAWAREEWEPACYQLPAHRLQLAHGVSGAQLIVLIKAWTEGEGKKDQEIIELATNLQPPWPWFTTEAFSSRFAEASQWRAHRAAAKPGPPVEVLQGRTNR